MTTGRVQTIDEAIETVNEEIERFKLSVISSLQSRVIDVGRDCRCICHYCNCLDHHDEFCEENDS